MALDDVSPPSEENPWRRGVLNDEEFERAAMAFSPSWEVGIDQAQAAGRSDLGVRMETGSQPPAPFTAAPESLNKALADNLGSLPATVTTAESATASTASAEAKAEPKTDAKAPAKAPPKAEAKVEAKAENIRPRQEPVRRKVTPLVHNPDDEPVAAPKRSMGMFAAIGAVALALVAGVGWSMHSSGQPDTTASTQEPAPTTAPTPPAPPTPVVAAPTPPPAPAVAPTPEPQVAAPTPPLAPEPPVVPPPAPVVVAPPPPPPPAPVVVAPPPPPPPAPVVVAPPPPPPAPVVVAPPPPRPTPVVAPHPVAPAVVAAHPAAPRPPHHTAHGTHTVGAGFVTDNPY